MSLVLWRRFMASLLWDDGVLGMTPGLPHPDQPCPGHSVVTPDVIAVCAEGRLASRSEEHTSELQSLTNLVCRLLLEKKKKQKQKKKNKKKKKKQENNTNPPKHKNSTYNYKAITSLIKP